MIIDAYEQSCLFYITSHDIFPSYTHHIPMISPPAVALFASPPAACFPRIWEISGKEMEVLIRTWRVINWKYGKNHRTKWELFHQAMFDCRRVKMECEMAWLWPVLTPHDKKQTVCDHDLTLCYFWIQGCCRIDFSRPKGCHSCESRSKDQVLSLKLLVIFARGCDIDIPEPQKPQLVIELAPPKLHSWWYHFFGHQCNSEIHEFI